MGLFGKKFGKGKEVKEEKKMDDLYDLVSAAKQRLKGCEDCEEDLQRFKSLITNATSYIGDDLYKGLSGAQLKNRQKIIEYMKEAVEDFRSITAADLFVLRHKNFDYLEELILSIEDDNYYLLDSKTKEMRDDVWTYDKKSIQYQLRLSRLQKNFEYYKDLAKSAKSETEYNRYKEELHRIKNEKNSLVAIERELADDKTKIDAQRQALERKKAHNDPIKSKYKDKNLIDANKEIEKINEENRMSNEILGESLADTAESNDAYVNAPSLSENMANTYDKNRKNRDSRLDSYDYEEEQDTFENRKKELDDFEF